MKSNIELTNEFDRLLSKQADIVVVLFVVTIYFSTLEQDAQEFTQLIDGGGAAEIDVNIEQCVSHNPIAGHGSSHRVLSKEGIMVLSGAF